MMPSGGLVKNKITAFNFYKSGTLKIQDHFKLEVVFFILKTNFACSEKIPTFVTTLGVSVDLQTETLPFEPDLDYTSVGKSR